MFPSFSDPQSSILNPQSGPVFPNPFHHRVPERLELGVADSVYAAELVERCGSDAGELAERAVAEDDVGRDAALLRFFAAPGAERVEECAIVIACLRLDRGAPSGRRRCRAILLAD